jgi:hypothetical protein
MVKSKQPSRKNSKTKLSKKLIGTGIIAGTVAAYFGLKAYNRFNSKDEKKK